MSGINKVILIGNLGKDPEVRHLENNVSVANFTLATTENYKDRSGQKQSQTEWHNITLWRGLAEVAEKYLKKGNQVYIEGKLRTRTYEKDGSTRYITEVIADNMTMLGGRRDSDERNSEYHSNARNNESSNSISPEEEKDDLPF